MDRSALFLLVGSCLFANFIAAEPSRDALANKDIKRKLRHMDHEDIDHRIPEDAFGRDYNNEDNEDADIDRARWQHFRRNDDGHEDEYNKGDDDEVDFGNENNDFDISEDEQHHHFDEDKPRNNPNPFLFGRRRRRRFLFRRRRYFG